MFKIEYVVAEKFAPNGEIIRLPSSGQEQLNTELGVQRFIDTMKPFKRITIVDIDTGKDITNRFIK